jgi:hypothetical protein
VPAALREQPWTKLRFRRRMTIEGLFRDEKDRCHDWALRSTQITRSERFYRLLPI